MSMQHAMPASQATKGRQSGRSAAAGSTGGGATLPAGPYGGLNLCVMQSGFQNDDSIGRLAALQAHLQKACACKPASNSRALVGTITCKFTEGATRDTQRLQFWF